MDHQISTGTNCHEPVRAALRARRSIRAFRDTAVSPEIIDDLLSAALEAPSWGNTQPYRVAIATGDLARSIADDYTALFEQVSRFQRASITGKIAMLLKGGFKPDGDYKTLMTYPAELDSRYKATGKGLYGALGIERNDKAARQAQMAKNFSFFGAPCALFVFCESSLGPYGPLDTGAFLQSLALAAEERGLGTCMQGALATWASPVRSRFDVPEGYKLVCGVSLGYPADDPVNRFAPKRRSLGELKLSRKTEHE